MPARPRHELPRLPELWTRFVARVAGRSARAALAVELIGEGPPCPEDVLPRLGDEDRAAYSRLTTESRRREWLAGRRCLLAVRSEASTPERGHAVLSSLAHSAGYALAVACAAPGIEGAGVDLERRDRTVTPAAVERMTHPSEHKLALGPIQLWVIKEACLKANPASKGTLVSHYRVESFDPATGEGQARYPDARERGKFQFLLGDEGEFHFAFALLPNRGL